MKTIWQWPGKTRRPRRAAARWMALLTITLACPLAFLNPALAHEPQQNAAAPENGLPPAVRDVDFHPQLQAEAPLNATFRDEADHSVRLGDYFGKGPVLLALVYYSCTMLCDQALEELARSLRVVSLVPGRDYQVVAVSFNPDETPAMAAAKKTSLLRGYPRQGADSGWHLLTGPESSAATLAQAVNFRYAYDPATKTYAHASGILIFTPQGKVSRYFYGIDYPARDLQFALMDASGGKIGSAVDHFILYCYHYDPATGKYGAAVTRLLRWGGAFFILGLASLIVMLGKGKRQRNPSGTAPGEW